MQIDAGARQALGVREFLDPSGIGVHLALDGGDHLAVARRCREKAPQAARGTGAGEEPDAQARGRLVEHSGAFRRRQPRRKRRARDPAAVYHAPATIPHPCTHGDQPIRIRHSTGKSVIARAETSAGRAFSVVWREPSQARAVAPGAAIAAWRPWLTPCTVWINSLLSPLHVVLPQARRRSRRSPHAAGARAATRRTSASLLPHARRRRTFQAASLPEAPRAVSGRPVRRSRRRHGRRRDDDAAAAL